MAETNNQAPGQQNYPKKEPVELESAQSGDEIVAGANQTDQLEKFKENNQQEDRQADQPANSNRDPTQRGRR
jgi:hypothetical protein